MLRELVGALVLFLVAVGYFALAREIPESALGDEISAHGLPYAYAALLALAALAIAVRGLVRRHVHASSQTAPTPGPSLGSLLRSAGAIGLGVLYLILLPLAGYLIATAALLAAMVRYLGEPLGWRIAAVALGGTAFLWLLFDRVLGISLPAPFGF